MRTDSNEFYINCKPRERLEKYGAKTLTDVELLSIILRSGGVYNSVFSLAHKILNMAGGLSGLFDLSLSQLQEVKDIGFTKAITVKALCELAIRMTSYPSSKPAAITSPKQVYNLVRSDIFSQKKEYLYVLSLDTRKRLISKDLVSVGTLNESLIHPREIYKLALLNSAASIILVHNHPSNAPEPSEEDVIITNRIFDAGVCLGVALIDHVIVTDTSYCSLKEQGVLVNLAKGGDYSEGC